MPEPDDKTRLISLVFVAANTHADSDKAKLAYYLDYLHVKKVKKKAENESALNKSRKNWLPTESPLLHHHART